MSPGMQAVMNIGGPNARHEEHQLVREEVHWKHQQQNTIWQRLHASSTSAPSPSEIEV